MFVQIALSTNKIHEEDTLAVLNHCTKGFFSQRILSIAFYKQKMSKTEILKPIGAITSEIYKKEFLKVIV